MKIDKRFSLFGLLVLLAALLAACSDASGMSLAFIPAAGVNSSADSSTSSVGIELEVEGQVTALTDTSITINGQTFTYDSSVVAKNGIDLALNGAALVKALMVDGQLTVVRIEPKKAEDGVEHQGNGNDDNGKADDQDHHQGGDDSSNHESHHSTATPEATSTPDATSTPEVTSTPDASPTPEPTRETEHPKGNDDKGKTDDHGTATPGTDDSHKSGSDDNHKSGSDDKNGSDDHGKDTSTSTPKPVETPKVTEKPKETETPKVTSTSKPSSTPKPSDTSGKGKR